MKNTSIFIKKKITTVMAIGRGYPNPSETMMKFDFSFPLGMSRVTSKYIEV